MIVLARPQSFDWAVYDRRQCRSSSLSRQLLTKHVVALILAHEWQCANGKERVVDMDVDIICGSRTVCCRSKSWTCVTFETPRRAVPVSTHFWSPKRSRPLTIRTSHGDAASHSHRDGEREAYYLQAGMAMIQRSTDLVSSRSLTQRTIPSRCSAPAGNASWVLPRYRSD
jgi:hypothetical protein